MEYFFQENNIKDAFFDIGGIMPKVKITTHDNKAFVIKIPNTIVKTEANRVKDSRNFFTNSVDENNIFHCETETDREAFYLNCIQKIKDGEEIYKKYGIETPNFFAFKVNKQSKFFREMLGVKNKRTHFNENEDMYVLGSAFIEGIIPLREKIGNDERFAFDIAKIGENEHEIKDTCPNSHIEEITCKGDPYTAERLSDNIKSTFTVGFPDSIKEKNGEFVSVDGLSQLAAVSLFTGAFNVVSDYNNIFLKKENDSYKVVALDIDDVLQNKTEYQKFHNMGKNYIDYSNETTREMVKHSSKEFKNNFCTTIDNLLRDEESVVMLSKYMHTDAVSSRLENLNKLLHEVRNSEKVNNPQNKISTKENLFHS